MSSKIQFTEGELLWIISNTSIFTPMTEGPDVRAMQKFRLNVLSAILFAGEINITEEEMWVALETVTFSSQIGTEKVGYNLIRKLGEYLIKESSSDDVDSAVQNVGEGREEGENRFDRREKFEEFFKEPTNAGDNDTNQNSPNNGAPDFTD